MGSCPSSNPARRAEERLRTGIDMPQLPLHDIRGQTDAALSRLGGDDKILVYGCGHGFDVTELDSPNTVGIRLLCSGMVPPSLIDYALKKGADGVLISGCRASDCFFRYGNRWMEKRVLGNRKPVLRSRVDQRRVKIQGAAETDGTRLRRELDEFRRSLAELREGTASQLREQGAGS
jgi:coenzyme F420-reducing hydrogenase delta subunit